MRAAITTPVGPPGAFLARFPGDCGFPRYYGGSTPTLTVSRPARCSLTLPPAWSAGPLKGPFPEVLQVIRCLLTRPECFRLEREFAGPDFHRGEPHTLTRHTQQRRRARDPRRRAGAQELSVCRFRRRRRQRRRHLRPRRYGQAQPLRPKAYLRRVLDLVPDHQAHGLGPLGTSRR